MNLLLKMTSEERDEFDTTVNKHGLAKYIADPDNVSMDELRYVNMYTIMDRQAEETKGRLDKLDSTIKDTLKGVVPREEVEALRTEVSELKKQVSTLQLEHKLTNVVCTALDVSAQFNSKYVTRLEKRVDDLSQNNLYLSNKLASDNRRMRRLNFRFYHSKRATEEQSELRDKNKYAQLIWNLGICKAFGMEPGSDCKQHLSVAHALTDIEREQTGDFKRPKYRSIGVFSNRSSAVTFWNNKDKIVQFSKDNGFKSSVGSDWDSGATAYMLRWGNDKRVARVHLIDGVLYLRLASDEKRTHKVLNEHAEKLMDTLKPVDPVTVSTAPLKRPPDYNDVLQTIYSKVFENINQPPTLTCHHDMGDPERDVLGVVGLGVAEREDTESDQEDEEDEGESGTETVVENNDNSADSESETVGPFLSQKVKKTSKSKSAASLVISASQPPANTVISKQHQKKIQQLQQELAAVQQEASKPQRTTKKTLRSNK